MNQILTIAQLVLSVLLITTILLQHRGTGLGGAFGGESNTYRSKRGIERFLFSSSVVLGVLFVAVAVWHLFLK